MQLLITMMSGWRLGGFLAWCYLQYNDNKRLCEIQCSSTMSTVSGLWHHSNYSPQLALVSRSQNRRAINID